MTFFSRLESRIKKIDSLLCVGLDPHPDDLPELSADAAQDFCFRIIEATYDLAAAYKPNSAFFEALGPAGYQALRTVISKIPEEIPVILDAKRGDIASTASAYARAVFHTLGADAVTINPYLGHDAVEPFLQDLEKGVFLLCKTSNPGAADFQDLMVYPKNLPEKSSGAAIRISQLYIWVSFLAQDWNQWGNLGLVVGATQLESLARVRDAAPDLWILAPGVGAQGGDIRQALKAGLRKDGLGILVPVSRGISRASDPRDAALKLKAAINRERKQISQTVVEIERHFKVPDWAKVADGLLAAGCIKFGVFKLKSGEESPIYIDLRRLVGYPRLLSDVAFLYLQVLQGLQFDRLGGLPYAALPIASAISLQNDWPMIYPRKEVKGYGTKARIEGVFRSGDVVVVVDDLISTGGSKFEGIEKFKSAGLAVEDIVVLIDRSPDAGATLKAHGFQLHAVLTLDQLLDYYQQTEQVPQDQLQATRDFLKASRSPR